MVAAVAPEEPETSPAGEAQESLPPLPLRVSDPVRFVRGLDPERFYADPESNPAARELGNMEKLRAGCEISIARSRIDILEKEIQKICAENIDRLRAEGAFVEYEKGQPPDPSGPGVVTFGEVTERGSTRVYYFYSEEYPEIHEKRAEEREVGETCVRRLLRIAEGESGEEGGSR